MRGSSAGDLEEVAARLGGRLVRDGEGAVGGGGHLLVDHAAGVVVGVEDELAEGVERLDLEGDGRARRIRLGQRLHREQAPGEDEDLRRPPARRSRQAERLGVDRRLDLAGEVGGLQVEIVGAGGGHHLHPGDPGDGAGAPRHPRHEPLRRRLLVARHHVRDHRRDRVERGLVRERGLGRGEEGVLEGGADAGLLRRGRDLRGVGAVDGRRGGEEGRRVLRHVVRRAHARRGARGEGGGEEKEEGEAAEGRGAHGRAAHSTRCLSLAFREGRGVWGALGPPNVTKWGEAWWGAASPRRPPAPRRRTGRRG